MQLEGRARGAEIVEQLGLACLIFGEARVRLGELGPMDLEGSLGLVVILFPHRLANKSI